MALTARRGETGVHRRGRKTETAAPEGVPRLQVQTKEESQVPIITYIQAAVCERGIQATEETEELGAASPGDQQQLRRRSDQV